MVRCSFIVGEYQRGNGQHHKQSVRQESENRAMGSEFHPGKEQNREYQIELLFYSQRSRVQKGVEFGLWGEITVREDH